MKMAIIYSLSALLMIYLLICGLLYPYQEKLIFFPQKLPTDYTFQFHQEFKEVIIPADDSIKLHGVLFKTSPPPKGLLFYLHGNAGALDSWGEIASIYTDMGYDLFILDYRGYGKSEGEIHSQKQFYADVQLAYNTLKKEYAEDHITIIGYSIGTGAASMLASTNKPARLILQAPYYSLTDMVSHLYPLAPKFILKYTFETFRFLQKTNVPVIIFHGDQDEVIYYGSSLKLQPYLKATDRFITLKGQGHNGITENPAYQAALRKILLSE
ncbi:MAG: alpha/beta fold hydrolase [Cytophagales bacterium]|nr:alpha/beta fold hydrolase [Cytophaga sp.]